MQNSTDWIKQIWYFNDSKLNLPVTIGSDCLLSVLGSKTNLDSSRLQKRSGIVDQRSSVGLTATGMAGLICCVTDLRARLGESMVWMRRLKRNFAKSLGKEVSVLQIKHGNG